MLKGKTVLIGVCGGIAAYKVVEVVSRLVKNNAQVHVIMTENATKFVAPLTFQTISKNPVVTGMFDIPERWDIKHISLAQKADILVVVPATANIIGKIAAGIADDMLTTTVMATKAPVMFVPSMNTNMYENPILKENILKLEKHGYLFMEAEEGLMACGTSGKGRLPEPETIVEKIINIIGHEKDMKGLKVLITAGPTREPIDPVRYITNKSSGKMGYALASAASMRGAEVLLVSGPVSLNRPCNVNVINVNTAREMFQKVMEVYKNYDVIAMFAAVADYRSEQEAERKIKKDKEVMNLKLVKNPDIAAELGKVKGERILVGACAETEDIIKNAVTKLENKNFDVIMANDITMEGAGFEVDTNIVKIINKDKNIIELPIMEKTQVAHRVLDEVVKIIKERKALN
ncbi:MAG: bifunctional phosphopantothenoylcysteine decarboxylase/phosphopantothenate--cysteine ligase CoaBC [Firmicutes bacterium]|nr:bifunctional phosphopantothenoylcysteine decarboxylase/phosphopantothenate--cysteine ligase CoaBC [Bacillota bacterium]